MHRLDFAFFMLNKIKQLLLSLACMIILVHAVIPHHHHQDKPICVNELEQQDCEKHSKCCDFGSQDDKHDFDKGNCIIDDYFTPKESLKLTLNHAFTYNHVVFVLPDITSVSDLILKEKGNIFRRTELALIYKNPLATNNIGLRAPPIQLGVRS